MKIPCITLIALLNIQICAAPKVDEVNLDSDIHAIRNRAKAYEIVDKASKDLTKSLRELGSPKTPEMILRKGLLIRSAIDEINKALELFPNYASAHEELSGCYFYLDTKETEELEIIHLKKARALDPARIRVHRNIISTYLSRKRYDDAEEAARELIKIDDKLGQTLLEEVIFERKLNASKNK